MEDKQLITGLLVVILALCLTLIVVQGNVNKAEQDLRDQQKEIGAALCRAQPNDTDYINTINYNCAGKNVTWAQQKGN